MTDSIDTTSVAQRFSASLDLAAEADRAQKEEAERQRQIAEGRLLAFIDQSDLSIDDLTAIAEFISSGCVIVNDKQLTQQMQAMQHEIVRLQTENDALEEQNDNLRGTEVIAFPDETERKKAEEILSHCKGGNGKFIDPNRVKNALEPKQQPKQQKGPSGPPKQQQSSNNGSSQDNKGSKPSWTDRLLGKA